MGHSLNGALAVECRITYFGSQFQRDTVCRGGEDIAEAGKKDMVTDGESTVTGAGG